MSLKTSRVSLLSLGLATSCLGLMTISDFPGGIAQLIRYFILCASLWAGTQVRGWQGVAFAGLAVMFNPIVPWPFGDLWPNVYAAGAAAFCVLSSTNPILVVARLRDAALWWFTPLRNYPAETEGLARSAAVLSGSQRQEAAALRKMGANPEMAGAHAKERDPVLECLIVERATWALAWWGLRMGLTLSAAAAVRLALGLNPL